MQLETGTDNRIQTHTNHISIDQRKPKPQANQTKRKYHKEANESLKIKPVNSLNRGRPLTIKLLLVLVLHRISWNGGASSLE